MITKTKLGGILGKNLKIMGTQQEITIVVCANTYNI